MNRIQKLSHSLTTLFNLLIVFLPIFLTLQWIFIDTPFFQTLLSHSVLKIEVPTPEGLVDLYKVAWTPLPKTFAVLAQILEFTPFYLSLFALKSIFLNYQKKEIFNSANASLCKYLGWLFFLNALIAKPLSEMLQILAVTLSNPPGHRWISLSLGIPSLKGLFFGILLIAVSWVMLEGSKLQEEQQLTI